MKSNEEIKEGDFVEWTTVDPYSRMAPDQISFVVTKILKNGYCKIRQRFLHNRLREEYIAYIKNLEKHFDLYMDDIPVIFKER